MRFFVKKEVDTDFERELITEIRLLQNGDHLAVYEKSGPGGVDYYHHGIFLGFRKGVADKQRMIPRIVDLCQFTDYGKRPLLRIKYMNKNLIKTPAKVVDMANNIINNPNLWGKYNILSNNCEHFATLCKTGEPRSKQVIEKLKECLINPTKLGTYASLGSKLTNEFENTSSKTGHVNQK